jgi:hypothetical protein
MEDNTATVATLKRITKAELTVMLANHTVDSHPALYAGFYDDAVKFVRNTMGKTRKDLLRAAQARRILPYAWETFEGKWGC